MTDPALAGRRTNRFHLPKHFWLVLTGGIILLILCIGASLVFGSRAVGLQEILDGLFRPESQTYGADVVRKRISRTVFSLFCGAALGVSGALMQSVTRNPIADPSILGVNTGASLFIVGGIAFLHISTAAEYIWLALAGAALTAVFVFGIGSLGRSGATPIKLVLAGAATSAALSSLVLAILIPRSHVMDQFRFWQVGSVGAGNWSSVSTFAPFLLIGLFLALLSGPALNALALGDDVAKGLGVRTGMIRVISALGAVLLCGAATALAGPIGFIGLLSTHVMRLLLGPDLRFVIPMSALAGALILTAADVAGRLLGSPGELEVGVVTAFIGAPLLILLAMKSKVRSL
ncbi:iron ABC transporter [Sporosarcina sp. NCCP-2716]|uniref:FecCD family ABC transporter permease n=1 Tax=Sporosarcina sp. NCCP-2716 TaxID=2943679 RepID=UPI00203EA1EE|nr:iron ABC transporter permease [Sporosarcina sp. NCCP-2716]GKV70329.1 iron ABC transporter [Sporosarcina sp. NCCP-2716]